MNKKATYSYSLFYKFIQISTIVIICYFVYTINKIENIREKFYRNNISSFTQLIEQNLKNSFTYSEDKLKALGLLISTESNIKDLVSIQKFLKLFSEDPKIHDVLAWSRIGWVSSDNKVRTDSSVSLVNPPIDVSSRDYIKSTKTTQDKLIFGGLTQGYLSHRLIIPAGMGVRKQNQYFGTLTIGFDVENIQSKLDNLLAKNNFSYIVLNKNNNEIILHSPNFKQTNKKLLTTIINNESHNNEFFSLNGKTYYQKFLNDFPFLIIVEAKKSVFDLSKYLDIVMHSFPDIIGIFLVQICLILLFYIYFVKPLVDLTKATLRLANGETNIDVEVNNSKEINTIYMGLEKIKSYIIREKQLIDQLTDTSKKLADSNLILEQKVEERTSELEKALAIKTDILNNVSHEIRTPIQGFTAISTGLVEHWVELEEKQRFDLAIQIAKNAHRLHSLIINLLGLSLSLTGKLKLDLQSTDFNQLIFDMIEECNNLYLKDKEIKIEFTTSAELVTFLDKEKINQVMRNLLINSIKFSPDNTVIKIRATKINNNLQCSISDQGIGIPKNELKHIFNPFVQSSRTKSKAGGTGLGLSICRDIIIAHKGQIWAENNYNNGARFYFSLPIILENKKQENIVTKSSTILIIDDEEACINSINICLLGTQYKLIVAVSGKSGLEHLTKNNVDIILLDLMLPDIYGLDLIKIIKQDKRLTNIPIIVQSGSDNEQEVEKAMAMGANCFIRKPYQKHNIIDAIENILMLPNNS